MYVVMVQFKKRSLISTRKTQTHSVYKTDTDNKLPTIYFWPIQPYILLFLFYNMVIITIHSTPISNHKTKWENNLDLDLKGNSKKEFKWNQTSHHHNNPIAIIIIIPPKKCMYSHSCLTIFLLSSILPHHTSSWYN